MKRNSERPREAPASVCSGFPPPPLRSSISAVRYGGVDASRRTRAVLLYNDAQQLAQEARARHTHKSPHEQRWQATVVFSLAYFLLLSLFDRLMVAFVSMETALKYKK